MIVCREIEWRKSRVFSVCLYDMEIVKVVVDNILVFAGGKRDD